LLAPRASAAAQNGFFQAKMLLILAAVACHVSLRRAARQRQSAGAIVRLAGAVGSILWFGVVLAGAAFILLGE
jgi:hypothetical protein